MRRRELLLSGLMIALPISEGRASIPLWQTLPPTPSTPSYDVVRRDHVEGACLWSGHFNVGGRGTPILLLHGGLANSNYLASTTVALACSGRHVVALDTRGHGRSTRSSARFTYDLLARDIIALLDKWGIPKADIVGWSDGANTGVALSLNYPERTERVFSFGGNANASGIKSDFSERLTFRAYIERTKREYGILSPTPNDFDGFSHAISLMWESEPRLTSHDLGRVACPTAVSIAAHDEAIKQEHALYMANSIPNADLIVLPGVSHFAMLQNPTTFTNSVSRFLPL